MDFSYKIAVVLLCFSFFHCEQKPYQHGKILYSNFCQNCHMEDGSGLAGLIPPLAQSDYLETHQDQLPCIIKHGLEGEIIVNGKSYNQPMSGINQLTEAEIANIINYINSNFGNSIPVMSLEKIRKILNEKCDL